MGLLDGGLQAIFGAVFTPFFLDGTLHDVKLIDDGAGGQGWTEDRYVIKGMVDSYSDFYRAQNGIPDTDARLIVLQAGVPVVPTTDSQITLRGTRYAIVAIDQDPAQAAWVFRGSPLTGDDGE